MQRTLLVMAASLMVGAGASASQFVTPSIVSSAAVKMAQKAVVAKGVKPLVVFKVGDTNNYNLTIADQFNATMVMTVKAVDTTGVTMDEVIDLSSLGAGKQTTEELIDPNTGAILEITVNGQKQTPPPADDTQIISETPTDLTVPAGSFHCLDVKTHSKSENTDSETWVVADGSVTCGGMIQLKTTQQGFDIVAQLTSFTHGS